MIPFPNKKYQIIYADPPWRYEKQNTWDKKKIFATEHFYPTMTIEEIKKMEVPAEKDSWLILWGTAKLLPEAIDVLNAWNFNYRICGIWNKKNGLGYFFRVYHEIILIGKRGNPPNPIYSEKSIFEESRTKYSKKPDCVRNWIEKAFPNLTKIELFARQKTEGWDVWGNEV